MIDFPGWDAREATHAGVVPIPLHANAESTDGAPREGAGWPDPGVRWPLVTDARARIAAGHYDRLPVREWIAEAVLLELRRP